MTESRPYLTFREAAAVIEEMTGRRPHVNALFRWWSDGLKGIRLKCISAGKPLMTTRVWLTEFFEDVAAARLARIDAARARAPRLGKPTPRDAAAVEGELQRLGI